MSAKYSCHGCDEDFSEDDLTDSDRESMECPECGDRLSRRGNESDRDDD